jgi:hypothetical protein
LLYFTTYEAVGVTSGRVIETGLCGDNELLLQARADVWVIEGQADCRLDYIDQGEILRRPTQGTAIDRVELTADGVDTVTLSGVPSNAVLTITHTATGETVSGVMSDPDTFVTTLMGPFKLTVTCWPYLDYEVNINAI